MGKFNPADSGYIEVKDRVIAFYAKHPEGSLQSEVVLFNDTVVVMKAFAFRSADDQRPGVGHSQMKIPGPTTFTQGSEIENAETSAIGRAIAALGFEVHRSYASANEVANKQADAPRQASSPRGATPAATPVEIDPATELAGRAMQDELKALAGVNNITKEEMSTLRAAHTDKARSSQFTINDYAAMKDAIAASGAIKAAAGEGAVITA